MNTERLLKLAEHIEALEMGQFDPHTFTNDPVKFNMGYWSCGTVACIGGWADCLWAGEEGWLMATKDILDLEHNKAEELFYPGSTRNAEHEYNYEDITPKMAASCIRHLVETGEVDWTRAVREGA